MMRQPWKRRSLPVAVALAAIISLCCNTYFSNGRWTQVPDTTSVLSIAMLQCSRGKTTATSPNTGNPKNLYKCTINIVPYKKPEVSNSFTVKRKKREQSNPNYFRPWPQYFCAVPGRFVHVTYVRPSLSLSSFNGPHFTSFTYSLYFTPHQTHEARVAKHFGCQP